jgi:hypothetical protein
LTQAAELLLKVVVVLLVALQRGTRAVKLAKLLLLLLLVPGVEKGPIGGATAWLGRS